MREALIRLALPWAVLLAGCAEVAADTPASAPEAGIESSVEAELPEDAYGQFAAVVARHQAMSERLARVSRTLRVANAPLCAVTRLDAGLMTHRLADYPPSIHHLARHFMDLEPQGRFVRAVVPGSPADALEIRPGEEIVSGWPIRADRPLVLETDQGSLPLRVEADTACVAPAFVVSSDEMNAGTDGREIELSSALVESVRGDAALAFIVAHEMAHVLRGHTPDAVRGQSWEQELQADRDALILMRNAGYDIAETVAGWEAGVDAHRESQSFSLTHPPLDIRLMNLERQLERLTRLPDGLLELDD